MSLWNKNARGYKRRAGEQLSEESRNSVCMNETAPADVRRHLMLKQRRLESAEAKEQDNEEYTTYSKERAGVAPFFVGKGTAIGQRRKRHVFQTQAKASCSKDLGTNLSVENNESGAASLIDLKTSMTRATVEDSKSGLGQILRAGRPLVGGLSFHGGSGLCMSSLAKTVMTRAATSRNAVTPLPSPSLLPANSEDKKRR